MTDLELNTLMRARRLLAPEGNWTQKEMARSASGAGCEPSSEHAVCWCAIGAIARAADEFSEPGDFDRELFHRSVDHVEAELDGRDLGRWNDHSEREHHQVVALLDRTISGLIVAS